MTIKFWKYNYDDGMKAVMLLEAIGHTATIIGGLRRKHHSNNDIDIFLPKTEYSGLVATHIMRCFSTTNYQITDWGSLYLPNTKFGTLDIFFKGQTDNFDY